MAIAILPVKEKVNNILIIAQHLTQRLIYYTVQASNIT
jgi:hypothetical protein